MSNAEPNAAKSGPKKFTGYHAAMIIVSFFAVVASVNFLMASLAIGSFSGTVVDNSYVASQKYNEWLEDGRQQAAHGWAIEKPVRVGNKLQIKAITDVEAPLEGATVTVLVDHPVGRAEPFTLSFTEIAPGQYQSVEALPAGRWNLKISIIEGQQEYNLLDDVK